MEFNTFNLDSRLQAGIKRAGYQIPTPIQTQVIPLALEGHDLIGTAQTGTGKTAAFVLPILHTLLSRPENISRALIVTPTRELAEQIHQTIQMFSEGIRLRSVAIYGGVNSKPQIQALKKGFEILVACPGRLLDLISQGKANLSNIEILVLDEADRMFDMGFLPDVRRIIKIIPIRNQTMLFSATFPQEVELLAKEYLRNPQRIKIGISRPAQTVSHAICPVPQHLKKELLLGLLKQVSNDSVLIFTRTKHRATRLQKQISREGYKVTSIHSNRSQNQRQTALNGFKNNQYQILVATDIAARGIDVENIAHVINFDMPDTVDAYIHRIGRTGRAERSGDALTLVTPEDNQMIRALERIIGQKFIVQKVDGFDYSIPPQTKQVSLTVKNQIYRQKKTSSISTAASQKRRFPNKSHRQRGKKQDNTNITKKSL